MTNVITKIGTLRISSEAFADNSHIPLKYTCEGENINPPLTINGIPEGTKSLALIIDDPDAPIRTWIHWLVWNIPPVKKINENSIPGTQGMNDFREHNYNGPCPPIGIHHYRFKLYALDEMLDLPSNTDAHALGKAINKHILAYGELSGEYERIK